MLLNSFSGIIFLGDFIIFKLYQIMFSDTLNEQIFPYNLNIKQFLTLILICVKNYHAKFYWIGSVFNVVNIWQIQLSKTKIYYQKQYPMVIDK